MPKRRRYYKGKRISKGELRVAKFLESRGVIFTREQTFTGCLSMKLYPLRFDFYLKDYNVCIEVQGQHHYFPINPGRKAERAHRQTVINDRIKREYMSKYSTIIFEIPYWELDNTEKMLTQYLFGGEVINVNSESYGTQHG